MSQPLTDQQLADIRRRHAKATGGTWYLQPNHGRDFVASEQAGYERGIGDLDFGVGDQADADREFVLNAHSDMTALFAEVSQLRAELAENTGVLQALRRHRDRAEAEQDQARAQLLHFAAEAHRRKWVYDNGDEQPPSAAFTELHRLGNELHAALNPTRES